MAGIDIDPFGGAEFPAQGEYDRAESRSEETMDEGIPLTPVGPRRTLLHGGKSTWEPTREQETSFRGTSQRTKLMKDYVKDLYKKLSENIGETLEPFHYDYFKLEGGELYYIGNRKLLVTKDVLKSVGMIADIYWVKIDFVDWVLTYLWVM